jgi:hypothetical protein
VCCPTAQPGPTRQWCPNVLSPISRPCLIDSCPLQPGSHYCTDRTRTAGHGGTRRTSSPAGLIARRGGGPGKVQATWWQAWALCDVAAGSLVGESGSRVHYLVHFPDELGISRSSDRRPAALNPAMRPDTEKTAPPGEGGSRPAGLEPWQVSGASASRTPRARQHSAHCSTCSAWHAEHRRQAHRDTAPNPARYSGTGARSHEKGHHPPAAGRLN